MFRSHEVCPKKRPEVLLRHGEGGVLGGVSDPRGAVCKLLPGYPCAPGDRRKMESEVDRCFNEDLQSSGRLTRSQCLLLFLVCHFSGIIS